MIRRSPKGTVIVDLKAPEGYQVAEMPPGTPAPGAKFGYTVPFGAAASAILLAERHDLEAGTRSYALRTLRAEINRIADFLLRDPRVMPWLRGSRCTLPWA